MDSPDDKFIKGLFTPLFYAIMTFSLAYFKGAPHVLPRKREQKVFVETLVGSDSKLYLTLKHPGAKERMVQAMIWNKLVDSLLSVPLRAYLQFPESTINRHVTDTPELYFWRTMTARFMHSSYLGPTSWGKGGPRRQTFVDETYELLSHLSVVKERDRLEKDLEDIAQKAFELATAMARSGAHWVCTMKDLGVGELWDFKMNTSRMEDVELWEEEEETSQSLVVDLVATPMLLKYGNSSGQNFDTCRVMKKAQVVTKPEEEAS